MHNLITVDPSAAQTDPIAISIEPSLLTDQVIKSVALAALALLAAVAAVLVIPAGAKALLATLASIIAALALAQLRLPYICAAARESIEANTIEPFNLHQRCAEQQTELEQAVANLQTAHAAAQVGQIQLRDRQFAPPQDRLTNGMREGPRGRAADVLARSEMALRRRRADMREVGAQQSQRNLRRIQRTMQIQSLRPALEQR